MLLALSARFGGLGIINPTDISASEYAASRTVTKSLFGLILQQLPGYSTLVSAEQTNSKSLSSQTQTSATIPCCLSATNFLACPISMGDATGPREKCFQLAHWFTITGIWVHTAQRSFSRCSCTRIWMAASTRPMHSLRLRIKFLSESLPLLS